MHTDICQLDIKVSDKCKCACLQVSFDSMGDAAFLKKMGLQTESEIDSQLDVVLYILLFTLGSWHAFSNKNKKTQTNSGSCGSKTEDLHKQCYQSGHVPEIGLFPPFPSPQLLPRFR